MPDTEQKLQDMSGPEVAQKLKNRTEKEKLITDRLLLAMEKRDLNTILDIDRQFRFAEKYLEKAWNGYSSSDVSNLAAEALIRAGVIDEPTT